MEATNHKYSAQKTFSGFLRQEKFPQHRPSCGVMPRDNFIGRGTIAPEKARNSVNQFTMIGASRSCDITLTEKLSSPPKCGLDAKLPQMFWTHKYTLIYVWYQCQIGTHQNAFLLNFLFWYTLWWKNPGMLKVRRMSVKVLIPLPSPRSVYKSSCSLHLCSPLPFDLGWGWCGGGGTGGRWVGDLAWGPRDQKMTDMMLVWGEGLSGVKR